MPLIWPEEDRHRRQQECAEGQHRRRTYLIYRLVRVEHHAEDDHRRMILSGSGLEIDLGLLRQLNNCPDRPSLAGCEDGNEDAAGGADPAGFRPGIKVTVMSNGGDERKGTMRWEAETPAHPHFEAY